MRDNGPATMTSKRQDWRTPECVLGKVLEFANAAGYSGIGLDPCSGEGSIVGATAEFRGGGSTMYENADGLDVSWCGYGLVFWNPPYNAIGKWVLKATTEDAESVGLITSRTDTRWFHDHLTKADALCFWRGRILFNLPSGEPAPASAPFPSLLPYFGPNAALFEHVFRDVGYVVRP